MSHDVFISYSTHDKPTADAACAALEAAQIRCWIAPRDIRPGSEWGEAIIDGMNECRVMVLIFSASANESPQIRREVERAVSKGIPVIPLRIENIAPAHSLEYFIGTVHWLDALTPPLEAHLRRLVETVKGILHVDPGPPAPSPVPGPTPTPVPPPAPAPVQTRLTLPMIVLGCLALVAVALGIAWLNATKTAQPPAAPSSPPVAHIPARTVPKVIVDPAVVGTFVHNSVSDAYHWRSVLTITAGGTYRFVSTAVETGTFTGGNGTYHTIAAVTGTPRTGTYRAVSDMEIAVTSKQGTFIFSPTVPIAPLNLAAPVMLGTWRATAERDGLNWTLTIQNNPDGTYGYQAQTEDNGTCTFANGRWQTTSAISGRLTGTYRTVNAETIDITGKNGPAIWHRQ